MTAIITVDRLAYAYPPVSPQAQPDWVLRGVSLEVEEGEFVSIMGPTGIGKTTLCLALNGIVPQSTGGRIRGDVTVCGLNTKREPVPSIARRVGMVFQDPETQLFNMTVEAELAFGLESLGVAPGEIAERIEWAAAMVGMSGFLEHSPFHLSGGQKQRVAIASTLAMTPRVLVLDEPTANLDPRGKSEVFSVVRELRRQRGMTIVMAEHDSERIAEFSDRVVVLDAGAVAMVGRPSTVFSQPPRMQAIGLAVPQVSEVAHRLNERHHTDFAFTQLDEADRALTAALRGAG